MATIQAELPKINKFKINQFEFSDTFSASKIISYYKSENDNLYDHYSEEWRQLQASQIDKQVKRRYFDSICSMLIDDNKSINALLINDLEKLSTLAENVSQKTNQPYLYPKMIFTDYWTSNAIRLKAYSDTNKSYYLDGKLSSFEYFLRSHYREKISLENSNEASYVASYQKDIITYRNTYAEIHDLKFFENDFFLPLIQRNHSIDYDSEDDIINYAIDDASTGSNEVNTAFFVTFQAHFNNLLSDYALKIKENTFSIQSSKLKHHLQLAKLTEDHFINKFNQLFNLYVSTYKDTLKKLALTLSMKLDKINVPKLDEYPIRTYFSDVEETFEDKLLTSIETIVNESVTYYNQTGSNDYIKNTENQIRNFYQDQLSKIYLTNDTSLSIDTISKNEIPILEEYKEKIQEFRNGCLRQISYEFDYDYPPINKYIDYSFHIGPHFQGLDRRSVIEWAIQAAKQDDLSLHSLHLIRLKTSEFIDINCMNGDTLSKKEILGSHELSVIMEKYAMEENKLLNFGDSLTHLYLQYFKRYYRVDTKNDTWRDFEKKVEDLIMLPITTYYNTSFNTAIVQAQAEIDAMKYDSGENTPFYTKMKNTTQQKIFNINDMYANEIQAAKEEFITTGQKSKLNMKINSLRTDIDREIDQYNNLVKYYVGKFNEKSMQEDVVFDKGPYYSFQNNVKQSGDPQ